MFMIEIVAGWTGFATLVLLLSLLVKTPIGTVLSGITGGVGRA
jgi:hypothetical protein